MMLYSYHFLREVRKMKLVLDEKAQHEIQSLIIEAVKKAVSNAKNERPYVNKKEIAQFIGVSPDTITKWVSMGMPVAVLSDGRKLYGKDSVKNWLKKHECAK